MPPISNRIANTVCFTPCSRLGFRRFFKSIELISILRACSPLSHFCLMQLCTVHKRMVASACHPVVVRAFYPATALYPFP
jgi:hypothetical protein